MLRGRMVHVFPAGALCSIFGEDSIFLGGMASKDLDAFWGDSKQVSC